MSSDQFMCADMMPSILSKSHQTNPNFDVLDLLASLLLIMSSKVTHMKQAQRTVHTNHNGKPLIPAQESTSHNTTTYSDHLTTSVDATVLQWQCYIIKPMILIPTSYLALNQQNASSS